MTFCHAALRTLRCRALAVLVSLAVLSLPVLGADETFETLTVGNDTFTNVTVLNKTRQDVFISHSKGMASLKVKELDAAAQLRLGYEIAQPKQKKTDLIKQGISDLSRYEADPRVQAVEAQAMSRFVELVDTLDPRVFYVFIGAIILSYLSFSSLCRAICVKSAVPPKDLLPLIWLPLLKQLPLLQAAGMSPWWALTNLVPGLVLVTYIVWGFKISRARGKNPAVGVLFLLPVFNLFAFLYLALSGGGSAPENASVNRNVISLASSPKREAA